MQTLSLNPSARWGLDQFQTSLSRVAAPRYHPQAPLPPAPALTLAPVDVRILIVNEDILSAASLKRTLSGLGYNTTFTAYSAKRALVIADDFLPSIALLDLELPDMTGFQLATKLHAHVHVHVRSVPLVAVAEHATLGDRARVRAGGFIDCLSKPVLPLELNRVMRTLWH